MKYRFMIEIAALKLEIDLCGRGLDLWGTAGVAEIGHLLTKCGADTNSLILRKHDIHFI